MAYINVDPDYFDHPKTRRLVGILGQCSEVYPIRLWCWCAKYSKERGDFKGMTGPEIEGILYWNGEPGGCINALVKCGFLVEKNRKFSVHDWKKTNGHIAAFSVRGKRNARKRWEKIKQSGNATSMPDVCEIDAPNLTRPNLTRPNLTKERVPPNFEDVQAYCRQRKNSVDPQRFHDFYESKGWLVGKSKMRSWKAAVRNWESRIAADASSNRKKTEEKLVPLVEDGCKMCGKSLGPDEFYYCGPCDNKRRNGD